MKKLIYAVPLAVLGLSGIALTAGATSTVMLDPPNVSEMVGSIYNVAQPLFNSISGWIWVILGFGFVFLIARWLTSLFNH